MWRTHILPSEDKGRYFKSKGTLQARSGRERPHPTPRPFAHWACPGASEKERRLHSELEAASNFLGWQRRADLFIELAAKKTCKNTPQRWERMNAPSTPPSLLHEKNSLPAQLGSLGVLFSSQEALSFQLFFSDFKRRRVLHFSLIFS